MLDKIFLNSGCMSGMSQLISDIFNSSIGSLELNEALLRPLVASNDSTVVG